MSEKVSIVVQVNLSSDSMCSIAVFFFKKGSCLLLELLSFLLEQSRVQTVAIAMLATEGVQTTPHRTHPRVLCLAAHARTSDVTAHARTPDVIARLALGLVDLFVCLKSHSSLVMSLLYVLSTRFFFFSSFAAPLTLPTASPRPPIGRRLNPCAVPL